MPDDPRTLVHVDSFEVREDGVYITGHIVPGPVADMMKTGVDYWSIRPAQVGYTLSEGAAISISPPRPAGRPEPPPITDTWTRDGKSSK